jgi:RNA polymerase sigma-70 factor (ECF subfamily)
MERAIGAWKASGSFFFVRTTDWERASGSQEAAVARESRLHEGSMTQQDAPKRNSRASEGPSHVAMLVERARSGDRIAFDELIGIFHEDIFRMVYYRTRSQMDAEDLTQDIFLQVLKHLPSLKDVERFRPWLFSIAVNRVRDHGRKRRLMTFFGLLGSGTREEDDQEPEDMGVDESPGALDQLLEQEFWEQVQQLSKVFSPLEREVFFLRFLDNLSIKEISTALSKSESAIKTHLYRALKKFKDNSDLIHLLRGEAT